MRNDIVVRRLCARCGYIVTPSPKLRCPVCDSSLSKTRHDESLQQSEVDTEIDQLRRSDARRKAFARRYKIGCYAEIIGFLLFGRFAGCFSWIVVYPVFLHAMRGLRTARSLSMPDARVLLHDDNRSPILYLRSFEDDGSYRQRGPLLKVLVWVVPIGLLSRRATYEEQLVNVLKQVAPVVAIGKPGEPFREVGAARLYVAENEWQPLVVKTMRRSQLVVVRVGSSEGVLWELAALCEVGSPERIILFCQPANELGEAVKSVLPRSVRDNDPRGRFIYFDSDWIPHSAGSLTKVLKHKGLYHFDIMRTIVRCLKITLLLLFAVLYLLFEFFLVVISEVDVNQ